MPSRSLLSLDRQLPDISAQSSVNLHVAVWMEFAHMALSLTQDQIKKLMRLLEESSTPMTTVELVNALKK